MRLIMNRDFLFQADDDDDIPVGGVNDDVSPSSTVSF